MQGRIAAAAVCLACWAAGCAQGPRTPDTDQGKQARIEEMCTEYRESYPDVPELNVDELVALQSAEDVVLVDVREPREREVSMIPGAIAKDAFERDKGQYAGSKVVVYCTIGYRSGVYAEELRDEGLDAYNLRGSLLAWAHSGKLLLTPNGVETKRVHVYGKEWNLLPDSHEGVW